MADLYSSKNSNDDVRRVKDACDIVRLVGEHVAIKPKGREFVCLCPFHDDHNPSMRVIPAKQIFHCFVCGTGGDALSFVQKFHKMEFVESLTYLAEKYGVTLTPRGRAPAQEGGLSRKDLLNACDFASYFYRSIAGHSTHGEAARAMIERRGISAEMVDRFSIGAAPDRFDGLIRFAESKGVDTRGLHAAGTLKERESGGYYDLLRHRLIFPIHDRAGRVIAFGGRKLREEDEPKYINSPETPLFNKSATLYGIHLASKAIQTHRTTIVTEGYMDVIACHQGGFANAVATLGTALTREHAGVLRTMCDTVVLLFDGDDAGQRAADRAVPIFFAEPIDVKIATLGRFTDAKDPDELLKRDGGVQVFETVLNQAVDLLDYRFSRVKGRLRGAGVAALSKAILEEVDHMAQMGLRDVEPVRQRLIMKRLAELGNLDEKTIRSVFPAGRSGASFGRAVASSPASGTINAGDNFTIAALSIPGHMLACLLCEGALWGVMGEFEKDLISPHNFESPLLRQLAQTMLDIGEDGLFPHLTAVIDATQDDALKSTAIALATRVETQTESHRQRLVDHWQACILRAKLDRTSGPSYLPPFLSEPKHIDSASNHTASSPIPPGTTNADSSLNEAMQPAAKARSVADRIQEQRERHATLGADRRTLPKK